MKRKYNVAITNWNEETIVFLKILGYEVYTFRGGEDIKYLFVLSGGVVGYGDVLLKDFDGPICDWQTEPDLVKALVCETDDDVFRWYCIVYNSLMKEFEVVIGLVDEKIGYNYRKATLQEVLDYFRKDKKGVEPIGGEEGERPKRMTRREFHEAINILNKRYNPYLKKLWDNNDTKAIFEMTGLNVSGMLNVKNGVEKDGEKKESEKPKREPDWYICPIDIDFVGDKGYTRLYSGSKFVSSPTDGMLLINESTGYMVSLSIAKAFFTPYYEQTIEEKIKDKLANFLLQKLSKEEFVNEIKELFKK